MKNVNYIFPIFIFTLFLFSCNSSSEADQKKIDSMFPQTSSPANLPDKDSSSNENSVSEKDNKPLKLSPADSARIADSIFKSTNGVRDFN
jgi:hypothetical protein